MSDMHGGLMLKHHMDRELVGGLEHEISDCPYIGNVIIPTDELHHFSEGLKPLTRSHG